MHKYKNTATVQIYVTYCIDDVNTVKNVLTWKVKWRHKLQKYVCDTGLILGLHPANERLRYFCNDVSHWLGASLESALWCDHKLNNHVSEQWATKSILYVKIK